MGLSTSVKALRATVALWTLLAYFFAAGLATHTHTAFIDDADDNEYQNFHESDKMLRYEGDIMFAAFFPIHKAGLHSTYCGSIQKEDGIQPLEAMLYSLDQINLDESVMPGIKLGAIAVDTCDNPIHAAEKALPLLKGYMRRKVGFEAAGDCKERAARDVNSWACGDNIVGVLGAQTSAVSLEVGSLGRLFDVPLVSYFSTSVTLCQRDKYPYFYRTVPSDKHQAMAIVELMKKFRWNYASVVHSDSDYGVTGYQLVKQAVEKNFDICLTDPITIYNRQFVRRDYERVVLTLLAGTNGTENVARKARETVATKNGGGNKPLVRPRVVIVFADRVPAGQLLQAAKDLGVKDNLLWIGSDAWASRESVVENREEFVDGALAIQPLRRQLPGYSDYFKRLIHQSNPRNPWFEEYLKVYHNCSNADDKYQRCNVSVENPFKYSQQLYVHFVRDAVYAFAHALHDLHEVSCESFSPEHRLCPRFRDRVFHDLKHYLSNVSFLDKENNFKFQFAGHNDSYSHGPDPHDGPPRYSIINFAKAVGADGREVYDWKNVGTYFNGDITEINKEIYDTFVTASKPWIQECQRRHCSAGEIKIPDTDDRCCWHCATCGEFRYRKSEYECENCPEGTINVDNDTKCVLIEAVRICSSEARSAEQEHYRTRSCQFKLGIVRS